MAKQKRHPKSGRYMGMPGMGNTLGPSHNSPSAPGEAARPGRTPGSASCNPRSSKPTSLEYGPQHFGPLKYTGQDY